MKPSLEVYEPLGNNVLLKINQTSVSDKGIYFAKTITDRWMEVVKKGPMASTIMIGDVALLGEGSQIIDLSFGEEKYIQVPEFALVGRIPAPNLVGQNLEVNTT